MFTIFQIDINNCKRAYEFLQEYNYVLQAEIKSESGFGIIIVMKDGTIFLKGLTSTLQEFGHISDY